MKTTEHERVLALIDATLAEYDAKPTDSPPKPGPIHPTPMRPSTHPRP